MLTLSERLRKLGGAVPPMLLLAALLLLNASALPIGDSIKVQVPLLLIAVFYWSVYRPALVPLWLVFLFGVLLDFLTGVPLGLSAFVLMAVTLIVRDQRILLMGQTFATLWFVFALFCAGTALLKWFLFGLVHWNWGSIGALWPDMIAGILLYPLVCLVLNLASRFMGEPAKARG